MSQRKDKKKKKINNTTIPSVIETETESTPHDSIVRLSKYAQHSTNDYVPSGSSYPWTDLITDDKWPSSDYIKFLKDSKTKTESKLKFDDKELEKIESFTKKDQCHSYRLNKNKSLALFDSLLILFDNILKVLPVVMLSSLPLILLNNSSSSVKIENNLIYWVYGIMFSSVIVALVFRWIFKNEFMIREQYIIAVNKKEEELAIKMQT